MIKNGLQTIISVYREIKSEPHYKKKDRYYHESLADLNKSNQIIQICIKKNLQSNIICMLDKYEKVLVDLNKLLEIEPNDVSKDQPII